MQIGQAAASGRLLKRVPGQARPVREALEEYEKGVAQLRQRLEPALRLFFVPEAKDVFRWRIQLRCGCTQEVLTRGENVFPDDYGQLDPISRHRLPLGQFWCATDHGAAPAPYREIVEWGDRRVVEFPGDPEESIYEGVDAQTWAVIRRPEPHSAAFWNVKLECGHYGQMCTDVAWRPEDGPVLVSEERLAKISNDFEGLWADPEHKGWPQPGPEQDHVHKMISMGWPRPEPEQTCYTCSHVQELTGYQRIGWLVPRKKPEAAPSINRERLAARLAAAEAKVQRLRKQLDEAGDA